MVIVCVLHHLWSFIREPQQQMFDGFTDLSLHSLHILFLQTKFYCFQAKHTNMAPDHNVMRNNLQKYNKIFQMTKLSVTFVNLIENLTEFGWRLDTIFLCGRDCAGGILSWLHKYILQSFGSGIIKIRKFSCAVQTTFH